MIRDETAATGPRVTSTNVHTHAARNNSHVCSFVKRRSTFVSNPEACAAGGAPLANDVDRPRLESETTTHFGGVRARGPLKKPGPACAVPHHRRSLSLSGHSCRRRRVGRRGPQREHQSRGHMSVLVLPGPPATPEWEEVGHARDGHPRQAGEDGQRLPVTSRPALTDNPQVVNCVEGTR